MGLSFVIVAIHFHQTNIYQQGLINEVLIVQNEVQGSHSRKGGRPAPEKRFNKVFDSCPRKQLTWVQQDRAQDRRGLDSLIRREQPLEQYHPMYR